MRQSAGAALAALASIAFVSPALAEPDEPDELGPPPQQQGDKPGDRKTDKKGEDETMPQADSAGRLLAYARAIREKKGCAEAAPTYRVIAGMGAGQEAAQDELGECLMDMKGASETETALFHQEGQFWLTRAAFAGNARAQRRLVMEMASPISSLHNPKGALMWALVYDENPTANLYGYKTLPPTLVPGLKSSLSAGDIADDETFAANFTPITLAKYVTPKMDKKKRSARPQGQGDGRGGRRGRRR